MSDALARPADDGGAAPPRSNAVVAVLAFAGIVVSLMQTLVIPIVPRAAEAPGRLGVQHRLGGHRHPARRRRGHADRRPPRRHARQAPHAAGQPRAAGVRLGGLRTGRLPDPDDRRPVAAGPGGRGRPARHQHHARRAAAPSGSAGSTALMSASLGVGGALGLPVGRASSPTTSTGTCCSGSRPPSAPSPSCSSLTVVPESKVRTGGRFDLVGALGLSVGLVSLLLADLQGRRLGLDQRHHPRPVRRRRRRPAGLGLVRTAHQPAAGGPAHHRPPPGAVHQPRLDRARLLDVRDVPGRCRSSSSCPRRPATASAGPC